MHLRRGIALAVLMLGAGVGEERGLQLLLPAECAVGFASWMCGLLVRVVSL